MRPTSVSFPGTRQNHSPNSRDHRRAAIDHVGSVCERRVVAEDDRGVFANGQGLSRQRGLVRAQVGFADHPAVSRNGLAGRQVDDVARHELIRIDRRQEAVAHDRGMRGPELQ